MDKKGVGGHVEFILAFVIFIVVVSMAVIFFKPFEMPGIAHSTLLQVEKSILEKITIPVEIYGVRIEPSGVGQSIAVDIGDTSLKEGAMVVNSEGYILNSEREGDIIYFDKGPNTYVFIKIAKNLPPSNAPFQKPIHDELLYKLGSIQISKTLSEKSILDLMENYTNNYETVKDDLGILSGADFGLRVVFNAEDKIVLGQTIPVSLEVFAKQTRKEILRADGSVSFADLVVSVW